METCPHGARLAVMPDGTPVLLDGCEPCAELLAEHPDQKVPTAA